jgi:hypothetical protein
MSSHGPSPFGALFTSLGPNMFLNPLNSLNHHKNELKQKKKIVEKY